MGPTGCGRSEVIRVLAKAISAGCDAPSNPYLQANNRKKVPRPCSAHAHKALHVSTLFIPHRRCPPPAPAHPSPCRWLCVT